jgi:hypothetical protein
MEPIQEEVIAAIQKDDWALALEVLSSSNRFVEQRHYIESKYESDVRDIQRLLLLPEFQFKKFKKDAIHAVESGLHDINHQLYKRLCVDFNYCDRRDMPLARLLSYLIGVLDVVHGSGAIALAVLIAKREYLDKVCNCPK